MNKNPFGHDSEALSRETLAAPLDSMDRTMDVAAPMVKSLMAYQMHMTGYAVKRTRAMMALPQQAAACRTPQDIWSLQMNFWQTAMSQFVEANTAAFTAASPTAPAMAQTRRMPTRNAGVERAPAKANCMSARDVIAFPTDRARPTRSN